MKIIILVAGKGTRLQPFTFTKAKAMVEVAGKPVLEHILHQVMQLKKVSVSEVIFIVGYLGNQIADFVISKKYPFKVTFIEQKELKGQAHAVKLAQDAITQDCVIWFVDTLSDANLDQLSMVTEDGAIYVKEVQDPRRFGQVKEVNGIVTEIKEKANPPISFLVNIGLYYVKNYKLMLEAIDELIEKGMQTKGEFYLMDAFSLMIAKGATFRALPVTVWKDCGVPQEFLETNAYLLSKKAYQHVPKKLPSSVKIIPPVFISDDVVLEHAVIGPNVSLGTKTIVKNARIKESIIFEHCELDDVVLHDSMIGEYSSIKNAKGSLIVGPQTRIQ
ncbi:MAG: NDP-sugar synthase [Candidatus Woesearchaeota archaeon]